jgi:hypothetical protein
MAAISLPTCCESRIPACCGGGSSPSGQAQEQLFQLLHRQGCRAGRPVL